MAMYLTLRLLWFANELFLTTFIGILFGLAVSRGVDHLARWRVPRGIGAALVYCFMNLSGYMGQKTGVPFPVISRISFGIHGAQIPALIRAVIAIAWFGTNRLGLVIGTAMVVNLLAAALAGIFIPLGLNRMGFDPAVASTVFVTTVTDVVGFFSFLGLASIWLVK